MPDRDPKTLLGERIRSEREARGMTQDDLGAACGIVSTAISHYECGRRTPSLWHARAIARALGVSLDHLCGDTRTEDRIAALEKHVAALSRRTAGSITLGGPRR